MGQLLDGEWVDDDVTATDKDGRWSRAPTVCRDWIRADGSTAYAPEPGRYHLWLAYNCSWSQRTLIARNLLGMRDAFPFSIANTFRNEDGWWFPEGLDDLQPRDGQLPLHRVYTAHDDHYTGRATVPVLWDRKTGHIVSNESADIVRMLITECGALHTTPLDLYPEPMREEIDWVNGWVYDRISNGCYKVGFARSQEAYDDAFDTLFAALDRVEKRLAKHRFLVGHRITEADIRLFPTLVRFDPVYFGHFKCNRQRIADFGHLSNYLRDLYQREAFRETVRVEVYKQGYYGRSERLNPSGIIPRGPDLEWDMAHDRNRFADETG